MGIDVADVVDAAAIADAAGTAEERQTAMVDAYDVLEADAGYIAVRRALYDEAGRPFDLGGDLP